MNRQSLDSYDDRPPAMTRYLKHYGWHFNRKLYEYAASLMSGKGEEEKEKEEDPPFTKKQVDDLLAKYGVAVQNHILHDAEYVAMMCRSDYLGRSVPDERFLAYYVRDTLDDADAPDGAVMVQWYAKMCRAGIGIDWDEML